MGSALCKNNDLDKYVVSPSRAPGSRNVAQKNNFPNFAVITVIFNPVKYKSRYDHYHKFEAHIAHAGVQLFTVECIFESAPHFGLPAQNFEITRAGVRHHIQIIAPSIMWMKENLINIAVNRLPSNIQYIAWLDADIEFDRPDWPQLTINELQRYPVVQLFELSLFLGPGGKKDVLRRDYSFGYSIRHNKPINPQHSQHWYAHPGYAWAMRRSAFNTIGGLLDFCIIGSGDLHFAFALLHRIEETLRPDLHQDYRKLAIEWGDRVAQLAQNGTNVGYVPVNLWHHWHGERSDRNYVDRWTILTKHQFSPVNDLEKINNTGLLRLADKRRLGRPDLVKRIEALERDIVNYFKSRNEDKRRTNPVQQPKPTKAQPPVPVKTQGHRIGGAGAVGSSRPAVMHRPEIWSSGPSGTHVDDDDYQHHHPHHHHDDQHHPDHHHDNDQHHHHCLPDDHSAGHHGNPSCVDNSGYNYDHSSGGGGYDYNSAGGFDNTNYGGPGSFY